VAAGTDEAPTTVSCSFNFAVASLRFVVTTVSVKRSFRACYCLVDFIRSLQTIIAVVVGLSAIGLAVKKVIHLLQTLDSKEPPNAILNLSIWKSRP
jgi:hypothetical protein